MEKVVQTKIMKNWKKCSYKANRRGCSPHTDAEHTKDETGITSSDKRLADIMLQSNILHEKHAHFGVLFSFVAKDLDDRKQ